MREVPDGERERPKGAGVIAHVSRLRFLHAVFSILDVYFVGQQIGYY